VSDLERWAETADRQLREAYRRRTGRDAPARVERSESERQLADLQPVVTGGPAEFLTGRNRIGGVRGLHSLMAFEVLNAMDGERSGLDIYRFVAAEAREAGEYYYGVVTPEAVLEYIGKVVEAGLAKT
jgi:hypothetical protein